MNLLYSKGKAVLFRLMKKTLPKLLTLRAAGALLLLLAIFPTQSVHAATEHGPKLIAGAPQRHTLVSCGTNTAQALTCIQSISVTNKAGEKPIVGKLNGSKTISGFDGRIGDSERPIPAVAASTTSSSSLETKVMVSNEECCHDPNTSLYLQKFVDGGWQSLGSKMKWYTADPAAFTLGKPSVNAATLLTIAQAKELFPEIPDSWNMNSPKITYQGEQLRFKIDATAWQWYSKFPVTLSPYNGAPEVKVNPGYYEEWTFPDPKTPTIPSGDILVNSDFQPFGATWCWTATQCSSNREEYTLYLTSTAGPETWKDNKDIAFTVTIRAPKSFAFGEVSGSAQNTTVKYGKDLPDFNGVPMREIIATFSPIATARSNQLAGSLPEEKAFGYTYDANLNIFGMHNDITDFLGPCGKLGGVQVVSNAMHSVDPVWDPATETIKVRLETPHFAPNGDLNTGYLEIRVPRASALCMWGLSLDGSIKASVSINYDDGSVPSVATVVGKVIQDDYLIITSGFHFSSPNLAIKITKGTATTTDTPTPAASTAPAKRSGDQYVDAQTGLTYSLYKPVNTLNLPQSKFQLLQCGGGGEEWVFTAFGKSAKKIEIMQTMIGAHCSNPGLSMKVATTKINGISAEVRAYCDPTKKAAAKSCNTSSITKVGGYLTFTLPGYYGMKSTSMQVQGIGGITYAQLIAVARSMTPASTKASG